MVLEGIMESNLSSFLVPQRNKSSVYFSLSVENCSGPWSSDVSVD